MSVYKVTKNDIESLTLTTTPRRFYFSGSSGVTGSVNVYPRQSSFEKDAESSLRFYTNDYTAVDIDFNTVFKHTRDNVRSKVSAGESCKDALEMHMTDVARVSQKKKYALDIERFTPTTQLTRRTLVKNNIKNVLMPHYTVNYPTAKWAYTNYNTINFFTSKDGYIKNDSVLIYPNAHIEGINHPDGYASGSYSLSGAFSFDFHINPRYNEEDVSETVGFKAGTIFHLSSSYALSLVTGSLKDKNGFSKGFRLLLQLNHSADSLPSTVQQGSFPNDLVFLSDDNSLLRNNWHHVVVRWGTTAINNGTGSFVIDGVERGTFVVPSGTILPYIYGTGKLNPDALCVGNFYEGHNLGASAQSIFFAQKPAIRDGLVQMTTEDTQDMPFISHFNHPLNAELHDLTIKRYYVTDSEIENYTGDGPGAAALDSGSYAFYLPPFFVEETPVRRYVDDHGGILQTPFFEIDGTTDDPFNVAMSFGVNGHYINLENFTKDFSTGRFPRLLNLTASAIDHTTDLQEANYFLYSDPAVAKRNLTILPCDDGNFVPNYEILKFEKFRNKYTDPSGQEDLSLINLDELVFEPTVTGLNNNAPDDFVEQQIGPSPETPGLTPGPAYVSYMNAVSASLSSVTDDAYFDRGVQKGAPLTIYQRTGDPSSNQVTFFNISNLYYGKRIQPGSFMMKDGDLSGSAGSVGITLRDDGQGNIYRADSLTTQFTQNSVGNIFYDEGVVVVKSPHLYFFGKNSIEISFKGIQNIYTQKYEILATSAHLNSSSNPTYLANSSDLRPSSNIVDKDTFVYVSGLNLHDENMNILAKARLAQPIIKREGDSILFKVCWDF